MYLKASSQHTLVGALRGNVFFLLCRSRYVRGGLAGKRGFQQGQRQRLQPAPLRSVRTPAEFSTAQRKQQTNLGS